MSLALGTRFPVLIALTDHRIVFEDLFSGGNIDLSKWTLTDTESKVSVSSGSLRFSGGKASPDWADPCATTQRAWPRTAGLTLEWELTAAGQIQNANVIHGWSTVTPLAATVAHGFYLNYARNGITNTLTVMPGTLTAVRLRIVLKAVGALYYYSIDSGATWNLIWDDATGSGSPLYAGISDYNGVFSSEYARVWRGSVQSPLVSLAAPTITPSAGAELLTDGGLEGNYTAGLCDSLSKAGSPTVAQSADVHGGSKAQQFQGQALNDEVSQSAALTAGVWYRSSMWAKRTAGALGTTRTRNWFGGLFGNDMYITAANYTEYVQAERCASSGSQAASSVNNATAGTGDTVIVDDQSVVALTLSSLHGSQQTGPVQGIWDRTVYCAVGYQAGYWLNWDGNDDGTEDYVEAIVDRAAGTARLSKCVAGTVTNNLISGAITYSAGAQLRVVRVGTSYALYYAGSQIGSTVTISDAGITNNTGYCAFGTDPTAANAADILTAQQGIGVA